MKPQVLVLHLMIVLKLLKMHAFLVSPSLYLYHLHHQEIISLTFTCPRFKRNKKTRVNLFQLNKSKISFSLKMIFRMRLSNNRKKF